MNDASRARAAPGAGAAASERATERAAEVEEEGIDLACPPLAPPRTLLLLSFALPVAIPWPPPSATPSSPIGRAADMSDSSRGTRGATKGRKPEPLEGTAGALQTTTTAATNDDTRTTSAVCFPLFRFNRTLYAGSGAPASANPSISRGRERVFPAASRSKGVAWASAASVFAPAQKAHN